MVLCHFRTSAHPADTIPAHVAYTVPTPWLARGAIDAQPGHAGSCKWGRRCGCSLPSGAPLEQLHSLARTPKLKGSIFNAYPSLTNPYRCMYGMVWHVPVMLAKGVHAGFPHQPASPTVSHVRFRTYTKARYGIDGMAGRHNKARTKRSHWLRRR